MEDEEGHDGNVMDFLKEPEWNVVESTMGMLNCDTVITFTVGVSRVFYRSGFLHLSG